MKRAEMAMLVLCACQPAPPEMTPTPPMPPVDPSCHYMANPPALVFPFVNELTGPASLTLNLTSESNISCVAPLSIDGSSFSINESSLSFAPGETKQLSVTATTVADGTLHVADLDVSLRVPEPCRIFPSDYDFGTIQTGCSSASRDFVMTGTCGPVSFYRGGEFEVVVLSPTEFRVAFSPTRYGPEVGALQSGDSIVSLQGVGDGPRETSSTYLGEGRTQFFLTSEPEPGTLTVTGTDAAWSYDPVQLTLNFSSPVNDLFTVSWLLVCR